MLNISVCDIIYEARIVVITTLVLEGRHRFPQSTIWRTQISFKTATNIYVHIYIISFNFHFIGTLPFHCLDLPNNIFVGSNIRIINAFEAIRQMALSEKFSEYLFVIVLPRQYSGNSS